jgi:hypothetical protein
MLLYTHHTPQKEDPAPLLTLSSQARRHLRHSGKRVAFCTSSHSPAVLAHWRGVGAPAACNSSHSTLSSSSGVGPQYSGISCAVRTKRA